MLQPLATPGALHQTRMGTPRWSFDLLTELELIPEGYRYLLMVIDCFSKWYIPSRLRKSATGFIVIFYRSTASRSGSGSMPVNNSKGLLLQCMMVLVSPFARLRGATRAEGLG